ncbi:MAG: hypothetical protein CL609_06570 [Anaerolineaceae bacterium]|nr:hypothetical protein [Anaerolineaceae bacterium]
MTSNIPSFEEKEISPQTDAFYVSFNLPVVDFTQPKNNIPAGFRIEPSIQGQGEWISNSTYAFFPDQGLVGNENYRLIVNRQLRSVYGSILEVDQSMEWDFHTYAPEVVSVFPTNEQQIGLDQEFKIIFSQPMQTESVAVNFRFHDIAGMPVLGRFLWNEDFTEMRFIPEQLLDRGRVYILELLPGSQMKGGGEIKETIDVSYSTIQTLTILSTNPENGQPIDLINNNNQVSIYFSASLDSIIQLGEFIKVFPEVNNLVLNLEDEGKTVTIQADFKTGVAYQILISKDIRDQWGGHLDEDSLLNFVVSPSRPDIRLNYLYDGHTIVIRPEIFALDVKVINLPTVQTKIYNLDFEKYIDLIQNPDQIIDADLISDFRQPLTPISNAIVQTQLLLNLKKEGLTSGIYAVELSAQEMQTKRFFIFVNQDFIISKQSENQLFIWAADTSSLELVKDQRVTIKNDQAEIIYEEKTNEQGVVVWDSFYSTNSASSVWIEIKDNEKKQYSLFNSAWVNTSSPELFGLNYQEKQDEYSVYWSIDKTVYSVREELTGYGFIQLNEFGKHRPPEFREINLNLVEFSNSDSVLYTFPIKISVLGSFIFNEKLPSQLPNGTYFLVLEGLDVEKKIIQIQNKPLSQEFSLDIELSKPVYFFSDDLLARIDLNYRYGEIGKNINFHWRIITKQLSGSVAKSNDLMPSDVSTSSLENVNYLLDEGVGLLNELGNYELDFPLSKLENGTNLVELPYLITLEVNIGNENEYIAFASKQTIVYPDRTNIKINAESFYDQTNQVNIGFETVDWQGLVSGGVPFDIKFQKLIKSNEGETPKNNWTNLYQETLRTDGQGKTSVAVFPNGPGIYKIIAENSMFLESKIFFLAGQGLTEFPLGPNGNLPLAVDKDEYIEGETVQLFVPNPFPESAIALITVEKEDVSFYDLVQIESGQKLINLNLDLSDVGSHFVSVIMISKNTHRIAQGYTIINKNASLDELNISTKPLSNNEREIEISVSDFQGNMVKSDLTLQVIKNENTIIDDFSDLRSDLLSSNKISVITAGVVKNDKLSILEPEKQILPSDISIPLQKNDQISWQKIVSTDSNGMFVLDLDSVPIDPINEKIMVLGVDESFQFGYKLIEVPSNKSVETSIKVPDVVYEGDVFEILISSMNMEETSQTIQAMINLNGLQSDSAPVVDLSLPIGSPRSFYWKVNADTVGLFDIKLKIINPLGVEYDYIESIRVLPAPKHQQLVKTGKIEKKASIDFQFLTSQFQNNPASIFNLGMVTSLPGILNPAVDSLSISPEFENEETAMVILSALHVLQLENEMVGFGTSERSSTSDMVLQHINHLVDNQNIDGGWGINPEQRSSEMEASLISTWALWSAEKNGFPISDEVVEKAKNYILAGLPSFDMLTETKDYDMLAWQYYILALLKVETIDPLVLLQNLDSYSPAGKAMISLGINEVWPVDPRSRQILTDLTQNLTTAESTLIWKNNLSTIRLFANEVQTSAFIVYALAKLDPANETIGKVIDSIYSHQTDMWYWETTYESGLVIMSISAFVLGRGNVTSSFSASATLNNIEIVSIEPPYDPFLHAVQAQIGDYPLLMDTENSLSISHGDGQGNLYYYFDLESVETDYGFLVPTNKIAVNRFIVQNEELSGINCSTTGLCQLPDVESFQSLKPIDILLQITVFETTDHVVISERIPAGFVMIDSPYLLDNKVLGKFDPLISASESIFTNRVGESNRLVYYAETIPSGTYYIQYTLLPEFLGSYFWPSINLFSLADETIKSFSPGLKVEIVP